MNSVLVDNVLHYKKSSFELNGTGSRISSEPGMAVYALKLSETYFILLDGQRRYITDGVSIILIIKLLNNMLDNREILELDWLIQILLLI